MEIIKRKFKYDTLITGGVVVLTLIANCVEQYDPLLLCYIIGVVCFLALLSKFYKSGILISFAVYLFFGMQFINKDTYELGLIAMTGVLLFLAICFFYNIAFMRYYISDNRDEKYGIDALAKYWWLTTAVLSFFLLSIFNSSDGQYFIVNFYIVPIITYAIGILRYKKACIKRAKSVWPVDDP